MCSLTTPDCVLPKASLVTLYWHQCVHAFVLFVFDFTASSILVQPCRSRNVKKKKTDLEFSVCDIAFIWFLFLLIKN